MLLYSNPNIYNHRWVYIFNLLAYTWMAITWTCIFIASFYFRIAWAINSTIITTMCWSRAITCTNSAALSTSAWDWAFSPFSELSPHSIYCNESILHKHIWDYNNNHQHPAMITYIIKIFLHNTLNTRKHFPPNTRWWRMYDWRIIWFWNTKMQRDSL